MWIVAGAVGLLVCLGGLISLSPVLLVFSHVSSLPGISSSVQEDVDILADLLIIESSEQAEPPVNIIHSLIITVPEEAVEQMLYETLNQQPGRFFTIEAVTAHISSERLFVELDVDYTLWGHSVFATSFMSEWLLRASPSLLASPVPNIVEITPLTIHTDYWPSVEWKELWKVMTHTNPGSDWITLEFTSSFRLEDLNLEEGELVLFIAPAMFL